MRLLPCLAAFALAASPMTTPIAEACGGYTSFQPAPPRAMLVTSHDHAGGTMVGDRWTSHRRSFALLAKRAKSPQRFRWALVAPRTYDSTRIRPLGAMPPRTLTLLGPSGTRVVTVTRHVELAGELFRHEDVHEASELQLGPNDAFEIALDGAVPAATWHAVRRTSATSHPIAGTTLAVTPVQTDDGWGFELRDGGRSIGTYRGRALGVVAIGRARYVAVRADGAAQLRAI